MKLEAIIKHIDGGKNYNYRQIRNNTWAVRTTDNFGDEVFGIQLHNTVVFAYLRDGNVWINSGGWDTVTTRERINTAFKDADIPNSIHRVKGTTYISRKNPLYTWDDREANPYWIDPVEFHQQMIIDATTGIVMDIDPNIRILPGRI